MAEVAPAPAPTTAPAKVDKKKRVAKPKTGPGLRELIVAAVTASRDRGGVSLAALKKNLAAGGYDVDKNKARVKTAIRALAENGTLVHTKGTGASGSFKLGAKATTPKAKKPAKKAAVKAKKPATKAAAKAKKPAAAQKTKTTATKKSPKKEKKTAVKKTAKSPVKAVKSPKKGSKKATAAKKSPVKRVSKPKTSKAAPKKK